MAFSVSPSSVEPAASLTASGTGTKKKPTRIRVAQTDPVMPNAILAEFTMPANSHFTKAINAPGGPPRETALVLQQKRPDGVWAQTAVTKLVLVAAGQGGGTTPPIPPADTTPPSITNVSVTQITETSAKVNWSLNEPGTGQVEYGTTTSYGSTTTLESSFLLAHSQVLPSLTAGTTYHYRPKSQDAAGNMATAIDRTFTTQAVFVPPPPPPDPPPGAQPLTQALVDAASPGDTLTVTSATGNVSITKALTINANGATLTGKLTLDGRSTSHFTIQITGLHVTNPTGYGIEMWDCTPIFTDVLAVNCGQTGIREYDDVTNAVYTDCGTLGCGFIVSSTHGNSSGWLVKGANSHLIRPAVRDCGYDDIFDQGIYVSQEASGTVIEGGQFSNNKASGIKFAGQSGSVTGATISGSRAGIVLDGPGGSVAVDHNDIDAYGFSLLETSGNGLGATVLSRYTIDYDTYRKNVFLKQSSGNLTLAQWQAATGQDAHSTYVGVLPPVGNSVTVASISALKTALLNDSLDEIVVANGTYHVSPSSALASDSLWIGSAASGGKAYDTRTRPIVVRAQTPAGVTFDGSGGGSNYGGLSFEDGAHHQTWDGFRFSNMSVGLTGIIEIGGYVPRRTPHHITVRNITIFNCTGIGGNPRSHGVYIAHALTTGPHDIVIEDFSIAMGAGMGGGIHFDHGLEAGTAPAYNVIARRGTISGGHSGIIIWEPPVHDLLFQDIAISGAGFYGLYTDWTGSNATFDHVVSTGSGSMGFRNYPAGGSFPLSGMTSTGGTSFG